MSAISFWGWGERGDEETVGSREQFCPGQTLLASQRSRDANKKLFRVIPRVGSPILPRKTGNCGETEDVLDRG